MKKSTSIEFKCSDFEREMFARAAQARGMSLSARDALRFAVVWLLACCPPFSPNGRWRGDLSDADLIDACKQLRVCEKAGLSTRGASAQSWDRCSLRCGCDPDTVNDGKLFWSDPVCPP